MAKKIPASEKKWKTCLTPEQYHILREKGTERAFTGKYYAHKEKGIYLCAACRSPLFSSEAKFDSGTGWPSFYDSEKGAVETKKDFKLLIPRTEILCSKCGGHLGHVFSDGPKPTGKRYCVNSVSLDFKKSRKT